MAKLKIEYRNTESLIPYARNARTHSDTQVAQIAASIKEFGFNNPVLLDGDNGIIAGHGRVLGARKLGLEQVPCIELSHLSEAQKRAYVLADNKIALNSGWDDEFLKIELEELKGFTDLSITGFDSSELTKLFSSNEIVEPEGDSILPAGEQNILVRLSFPAAVWLGKRDEIIGVIEKMEKLYLCQKSVKE
jgi:ParB-like chromosome segregation protein Spo0J